jgi:hypothetical protein
MVESRDNGHRLYVSDREFVDDMQLKTQANVQNTRPERESEFVKPYLWEDDYAGMEYQAQNYDPFIPDPWTPDPFDPEFPSPVDPNLPDLEDPDDPGIPDAAVCLLDPSFLFIGIGTR